MLVEQENEILKEGIVTESRLFVRSKSLGMKNDLSYLRSSDLRIHTGIDKKRFLYKSKTNKEKENK